VPFVAFVVPWLKPRRVPLTAGLLFLAGLLVLVHAAGWGTDLLGLHRVDLPHEPWQTMTWLLLHDTWAQVIAAWAGLMTGLTMTSRAVGRRGAWGTLLIATATATGMAAALPGGLSRLSWPAPGGVVPVYAAFGMGIVAWWKMRHELTYRRRADWIAGFGTIALVVIALAAPVVRGTVFRPHLLAAALIGALGVALLERHWEPAVR
jgi:hypothetical protein